MAINTNTFVNGIKILKNALFPSTTIVSNTLIVDASQTTENTLTLPKPASGTTDTILSNTNTATVTNKSIDADTNTITNIDNADIKAAAGIVYSKLSLSNSIVNADINASADIEVSKLESLTTGKALQSNTTTGKIEASAVTNTELGHISGLTSALVPQLVPAGAVMPYAGSAAPTGYLLCDGSAISRTTYAALFATIATIYGIGDGSTTFNLPDLRGRTAVGKDNMGGTAAGRVTLGGSGISGITLGATGGSEVHSLTEAQLAIHTHIQNAHEHDQNSRYVNNGTAYSAGSHSETQWVSNGIVSSQTGTVQTNTAGLPFTATNQTSGLGQAHNNTQPSIVLNYIIKY